MRVNEHPFVERIRIERAIVTAVNKCRNILSVELVGTSEKAIANWYGRIPDEVRCHEEVSVLFRRLNEASRVTRLSSNGSHRGAMLAERVRSSASMEAVEFVEQAISEVLRLAQKDFSATA